MEISHSFDFRFFSIKDTGQETSIQIYRRLATLLFVDWLPQVNGFAASFFVYSRESNLWNKISRTKLWKLLIENSFGIYLFHQQIIYLTIILLNGRVLPIVQVFLSFSIAIVVTSFMVIILRKFKITRLLFSL